MKNLKLEGGGRYDTPLPTVATPYTYNRDSPFSVREISCTTISFTPWAGKEKKAYTVIYQIITQNMAGENAQVYLCETKHRKHECKCAKNVQNKLELSSKENVLWKRVKIKNVPLIIYMIIDYLKLVIQFIKSILSFS